jgi:uncharacterized protein (DUF2062 family)
MPKKWMQQFMPSRQAILTNPYLKIFGDFLHDPNFWHLNRYCVSTSVSIGLFVGYMPFPGHMILAALFAMILRANLPISVAMVWVSNPFTMAPMFYFAYKVGTLMLHIPPEKFHFEVTFRWLFHELAHIALPLLVGTCICGTLLALIGNLAVRLWWRYATVKAWKIRNLRESADIHS